MITITDEKTLDDEVDDLKEAVEQLRFDVKAEKEERKYETQEIRIDIGRVRIEKKEWEKVREGSLEMEQLEREINHLIGVKWWKPYIEGVFWSNMVAPINISISILSLLVAGQSSLSSFISPSLATTLSFSVFTLSFFNTFFSPHNKIVESLGENQNWKQFANRFERIYYSSKQTEQDIHLRLEEYRKLIVDLKEYLIESPSKKNLFIECLYSIVKRFKRVDRWMELVQKEKI